MLGMSAVLGRGASVTSAGVLGLLAGVSRKCMQKWDECCHYSLSAGLLGMHTRNDNHLAFCHLLSAIGGVCTGHMRRPGCYRSCCGAGSVALDGPVHSALQICAIRSFTVEETELGEHFLSVKDYQEQQALYARFLIVRVIASKGRELQPRGHRCMNINIFVCKSEKTWKALPWILNQLE